MRCRSQTPTSTVRQHRTWQGRQLQLTFMTPSSHSVVTQIDTTATQQQVSLHKLTKAGFDVTYCGVLMSLALTGARLDFPWWFIVSAVGIAVTLIGAGVWLRAQPQSPAAAYGFIVAALVSLTLVAAPVSLLVITCAVTVAWLRLGFGTAVVTGMSVLGVAVGVLVSADVSTEKLLVETIGVAFFVLFGGAFARVAVQFAEQQHELDRARRALDHALAREHDVVIAQERERSAHELHDGLGHQLTAIKMSLEFAQRTRDRAPEPAWAQVDQAQEHVVAALADIRTWVRALRPASGFVAADPQSWEQLVESFRGTNLAVTVAVSGAPRELPDSHTTYVYRFLQEGLTNALKHGGATTAQLRVAFAEEVFTAELVNNGAAFPAEFGQGFGLRTLQERAQQLAGEFEVVPRQNEGQVGVRVTLPYAAESGSES